jgi:hypothetical protein
LAALLLLAGCNEAACPTPDLIQVPLLDDAEKSALGAYLARHADLRPAAEPDCGCDDEIAQMRNGLNGGGGPDYEPFVARGDFNGDGEEDFAVILLEDRAGQRPDARLVVFNGPDFAPAAEFRFPFAKYNALFFNDGVLKVGAFYSEACVYAPDGATYREECGEE